VPRLLVRSQRTLAAIAEADAGSGDEVAECTRRQHLAGRCVRRDLAGNLNGQPADLALADLAFARVQADAEAKAVTRPVAVVCTWPRMASSRDFASTMN
jgi:hypothetical protein